MGQLDSATDQRMAARRITWLSLSSVKSFLIISDTCQSSSDRIVLTSLGKHRSTFKVVKMPDIENAISLLVFRQADDTGQIL